MEGRYIPVLLTAEPLFLYVIGDLSFFAGESPTLAGATSNICYINKIHQYIHVIIYTTNICTYT